MVRTILIVVCVLLLTPPSRAADTAAELQSQADDLRHQLQTLEEGIRQLESDSGESSLVDLTPQQRPSIDEADDADVLSNPWWRNFDISGFAAAGYYDTGSAGTRASGGFEIKEATFFITAEVWDDVEFFLELQTNRLGKDEDKFTRTGEVYVHFYDIALSDSVAVGVKLGRIDIPFGEEYLWQDSIDNPLITNSAAYPYGWDEGVLVYGDVARLSWIAAITDGTDDRSIEENSDKAINLKFYGNPLRNIYLSLSLMANGDVSKSAIEFGGSHFRPVGAAHLSTLGASASTEVSADLAEFNAKYSFSIGGGSGYVAVSYGVANADDSDSTFDRDFRWFSIEPQIRLNQNWYALLRHSEIGTYNGNEGYHFDGKTFAGGNSAFGYDTKSFQRTSIGVGWTPNPRVRAKLELAQDRFDLIDASALLPNNGDRGFAAIEIAVGF